MFCHKCGSKALDGAEFCQKCGAKLIADDTSQPTASSANSLQQSGNTLAGVSEKKKGKKLPIILGVIAGIFILIVILAAIGNGSRPETPVDTNGVEITPPETAAVADTSGSLLCKNIPVDAIMQMTAEDIIAAFGEPDVHEPDVYYDTDRIEYESDQLCFIMSEDDGDGVFCLDAPAEKFTLNDQGLNLSFDDIVSILGDDYDILGGSGYQWNIGDLSYTFHISKEDNIGDIIEVSKIDTDSPIDNDAYLGDDDSYGSYADLDPALVGRWRSYDGNALALNNSGGVNAVFQFWNTMNGNPEYITWEASNGRLTLYGHYTIGCYWIIGEMDYMGTTMEMLYMKKITADNEPYDSVPDLGTSQYDYYYFREKTGTGLAGTWTTDVGIGDLKLAFYEDGTGMVGNNNLTWWTDDAETALYYYPVQAKSYDYTVSGDTLTVFFSDGSRTYTRVGD